MILKRLTLLFIFALFVSPVFAQDKDFKSFDTDNDGLIERYEFVDVFTDNYLEAWGITEEVAAIEPDPFYATTYTIVDTDDDERLDEDEWVVAREYYYGDYFYDDYAMYDVDNDGFVEYVEYFDAMYDSGLFEYWDVDNDGLLDKYELAYAIFDEWDLNENGVLDKAEYNALAAGYLI